MTTQTLPEADVSQNCSSWKSRKVALRKAAEFAALNNYATLTAPGVDEVFEAEIWDGQRPVTVWLQYTVSETDEGWTITSHRWYSNPRPHTFDNRWCTRCGVDRADVLSEVCAA